MKTRLLLTAVLGLFYSASAQPVFNPEAQHQIVKAEASAHKNKINPQHRIVGATYDISYHRFNWMVDPAVNAISGSVFTQFTPTQNGFDSICFNLASSHAVYTVTYHGNSIPFNHVNDILSIPFPATIPNGTLDSVEVSYYGTPPASGLGSFVQDQHNGVPIVWTLSEPYGASDWWPCKNDLTDKADSTDMYVTVPIGNKVAGNGVLVSIIPGGASNMYHWKHRHPIATYLVAFAVTNYAEFSNFVPFGATNTEVLNYVFPEDSATAVNQVPGIIPVMQLFDTLFGIYPFANEKYGHAQFGWGGGMEHQTMSFMVNFGHDLMAHELAHQWFGDDITCGSWEDIWLNEGFATYLTGLTYEHMFGGLYWPFYKKLKLLEITSAPDGSVWVDDTTDINRIFSSRLSYSKGAMVLHQLRWVIGDSAFFAAINNYRNDPQLSGGFARTHHLKAHMEAASGINLTGYFNDWFTGEGHPSYQLSWSQTGSTVSLQMNQTQSDPSVSFFEMPFEVKMYGAGQDTTIRFDLVSQGQLFNATIPFTLDSIQFDPNIWLISANNVVLGINENTQESVIGIYPNPAQHSVTITGLSNSQFTVHVFDMTGKRVLNTSNNKTIDISNLRKGVYTVEVSQFDKRYVHRLIKQ